MCQFVVTPDDVSIVCTCVSIDGEIDEAVSTVISVRETYVVDDCRDRIGPHCAIVFEASKTGFH